MRIIKTKQKEKYYDGSDIAKTGATYRLVVGMRSNGKTYYTISRAIIKFFKEGKGVQRQTFKKSYKRLTK